jgi:hypothetical protein
MPSPPQTTSASTPVCHALAGQVEGLAGVAAGEVADHETGVRRRVQGRLAGTAALALAGSRVGDQGDLPHLVRHGSREYRGA